MIVLRIKRVSHAAASITLDEGAHSTLRSQDLYLYLSIYLSLIIPQDTTPSSRARRMQINMMR